MNGDSIIVSKIIDSEPILIAGLREALDENSAQSIPLLWQKFSSYIGHTKQQRGHICYGLCGASDATRQAFFYLAGFEVSEFAGLPTELSPVILPSQRYAVFVHGRHVSHIRETIDAVFDQWLPQSGYQHANQSLHFFERYSDAYDPHTGLGGMEIWLPISDISV